MSDRVERRRRLTPEQKWQVFLEASRKNTTDAEVCRRWGITPLADAGDPGAGEGRSRRRARAWSRQTAAGPGDHRARSRGGANLQGAEGARDQHAAAGKREWRLIGPSVEGGFARRWSPSSGRARREGRGAHHRARLLGDHARPPEAPQVDATGPDLPGPSPHPAHANGSCPLSASFPGTSPPRGRFRSSPRPISPTVRPSLASPRTTSPQRSGRCRLRNRGAQWSNGHVSLTHRLPIGVIEMPSSTIRDSAALKSVGEHELSLSSVRTSDGSRSRPTA